MQVLRVGDPDAPDHDPEDNVRAVAGDGRRCVPGGGGDRCGDGGPAVRARLTYPKVRETDGQGSKVVGRSTYVPRAPFHSSVMAEIVVFSFKG